MLTVNSAPAGTVASDRLERVPRLLSQGCQGLLLALLLGSHDAIRFSCALTMSAQEGQK